MEVIDSIRANRVYEPEPITNLDEPSFFYAMNKIIRRVHSNEYVLQQALTELIRANKHIPFAKSLFKRGVMDSCENNWNVLLACVYANRLITYDDDIVGEHDWEDYFQESINIRTIKFELKNRALKLCRLNLIELAKYEGIEKNYYYHFTNQAKKELFPNHPFLVVKRENKQKNK